ncbi:metallophosphoesterase family protein [Proteiniphilum saccharofermentans]|nr:metallophosphoesterase [Proteiniphilum saccharofermentans]
MLDLHKCIAKRYCHFLILLLVFLIIPVFAFSKERNDTLKFVHLTDVHLILNPISYDSSFVQRRFGKSFPNAQPFVKFLNSHPMAKKTDFVVVTGDMIDFYEAESTEGGLMGNQIELFHKIMNYETNSVVYLVLGNHDIASYPKNRYHQNHANIAKLTWVKNLPVFHQGTYYSRIYNVGSTVYRLIFLDNAYLSVRTHKEQAAFIIDRPQLDWLQAQLDESSDDKEIIFMHIPLPTSDNQDEKKGNPSLSYDDYVNKTNTQDFLDVLKETNNASVQLIVAGHIHRNDLFDFNFSEDFSFKQIITGAFRDNIDNWRLFQLTESDIMISIPDSTGQTTKISLK